ncbi:MAG TPA: NAD-dependent epimerase/dehydratase family protein [Anaeromyxobacter sp.]|nr:NAD-dependent epimerase/dehydratase family protein [Anaeromyxobacter sp.]
MRVLVTGATGFLGAAICRELLARGHAVRALVRPASALAGLDGLGAEIARGDVLDAASVRAAMAACDAVVHAAGVPRIGGHDAEVLAVNVRGAELVLGAALEARVARAVLTSSVSAAGGTRAPAVTDESTPGNAEALGIGYFVSKLRGEQAGLALAARGLPLVVLRPGLVLGPGDTHRSSAELVVAIARRRLPGWVEGGTSLCDVRDVARGHAEALARGRAGEVYVLGGHNLRVSELVARVAAAAGVPPPPRLPYAVAYAAAALQEARARLRGRSPRTTRALVRAARLFTFVSSAKAARELGYAIRPLDEMVRDTLRFAIATGRLTPVSPELRGLAAG